MKIEGIHIVEEPFLGHGSLTVNGKTTDNLRKLTKELIIDRINSLDVGVMASFVNEKLVLDSPKDFVLAGNQDALDVFGITATEVK